MTRKQILTLKAHLGYSSAYVATTFNGDENFETRDLILALQDQLKDLTAKEEELEGLKDSTKVHTSILRGTIALTRDQALHIAGANDYDAMKEELNLRVDHGEDFRKHLTECNAKDFQQKQTIARLEEELRVMKEKAGATVQDELNHYAMQRIAGDLDSTIYGYIEKALYRLKDKLAQSIASEPTKEGETE